MARGPKSAKSKVEARLPVTWVKSELGEGSTFTFTLAALRGE